MIRHIVMWKFRPGEGKKMHEFLEGLNSLNGRLDMIRHMETGINIAPGGECDAVLVSDFDSLDALEAYKKHPEHLAVSALCKSIRESRYSVDYEIQPY